MPASIAPTRKPRNPFVAAARFRRAGKHGPDVGGSRQSERQALKAELSRLELPRDVRRKPPSL